ncbi:hypothetical protein [Rariglobus hedericola]|uniref:Replication-associated protein G2P N-terminal domain-containing protein n=1 Tax=Rariglobus hedericola TaxID=2597822 RepID=A0A556QJF9_9BACT|nr:hypothetical protein [Rariglobus hedericola]TSJ76776.1 hypothetical protein FPL22_11670 [Rariglobus hedericola]
MNETITVRGSALVVTSVEVNWSRLLHNGHHGFLIKSQQEIDAAWDLMIAKLNEISRCLDAVDTFKVTSIELGWNFLHSLDDFTNRARLSKHDWVHADPGKGPFRQLVFRGSEFQLSLYDKKSFLRKCREIDQGYEDVMRVEATLSGRKLSEVTGLSKTPISRLSFSDMCQWLRECMAPLSHSKAVTYSPGNTLDVLAHICAHNDSQGLDLDGIKHVDFVAKNMTPRTASRFRKAVRTKVQFNAGRFSWRNLFPDDGWPSAVELSPSGLLVDGVIFPKLSPRGTE